MLWLLFTTITVYSLGLLISKLQKSCEAVVKALPKEGRKKAKKRCARQYIFFGMYHYVLILGGNMIEPLALAVTTKLRINRLAFPYRLLQMFRTTVLVCIGELFFRADSLDAGMNMFTKIFTDFSFSSAADLSLFQLGADIQDFIIVAAVVVLVLIIGIFNERKISIREKALNKHILLSFALSYALTMIIVIFGAYGDGYTPVDPIYAGF